MQLSLLMKEMLLILLTVKLPCTILYLCTVSNLLYNPKRHVWYTHYIDFILLVKVSLHPLKELLRVIHLPWLYVCPCCYSITSHFLIITRMYLKLGLQMMLLLLTTFAVVEATSLFGPTLWSPSQCCQNIPYLQATAL